MASTADFRNGMVIEIDGDLWAITYFQHVKPGKGGAFVRTKLKNVLSGSVVDKGSLTRYLPYLMTGLKHSLQDMGIRSMGEVHERLYDGRLRFELRSPSSQVEGGVHDLHSYTRKDFS